ncbi:Ppx/GppA family phosphatase [Pelagimonas varians]|uniref:Guanosine-5'-triphosphate,3'-diphosphate pyrophosphatase n=1 Tax=Pelagimonas varians TaxID=696760 RepID=A0A238KEG3_9RHOB|nr:Ppx/GppA family phosphatase [Pelagimonas varians]PYG30034.1 exopolyphosphatase/guanosine-5'-triphosphate,3'-diphosphate pyrophosphatase [Pelagimonas varians]SMX40396.1 Guanosine-5'-triphosphate,3'-diphosphate pyrophosphatase [Pelagimonas varians]
MQETLPQDDWSHYGRPLFDDPKSRALSRVGVVDIGSNSVRLVVFDGAARSPAYFFNEKILCGLGAGMNETGLLNPEGKQRALVALKRFQCLADGMSLAPLTVVATAAMREAKDGPAFRKQIEDETGLKVWVIDGVEEARLSAQGVLLGWPGSFGLICDIGGSSMELAEIHDGEVGRRISSSLGPLKLRDIDGGQPARLAEIKSVMKDLVAHMGAQRDRLFLVGGSWRALAKVDMQRRNYPLHVLHEYRMSAEAVTKTIAYLNDNDSEELRKTCGISSTRWELLPYAAEVLGELLDNFNPKDIAISSYGIREGMLYEQMSGELRHRDPLIEACRFAEAKDARIPGFGKRLYDFVKPLFPNADIPRRRLFKAACLLHDVSWRAHPDYRAEICFDNATRANLGGLKHSERVFLGIALLHRYRNKREGTHFEELFDLLDQEDQLEAEILGKALRFGAMLWMEKLTKEEAHLRWDPEQRRLTLRLSENAALLYGEVTEARFNTLAATLSADQHQMEIV